MPSSTIQKFSKAIDLLMDRMVERSLELFKEINDSKWVVECLSRLNRYGELIEFYENIVTAEPDQIQSSYPARFFLQVAIAYKKENELVKAKKILLKSLGIKKTVKAYLLLANIFIAEEKPQNTLTAIKNARILMGNVNSFEIHELLGDYYHLMNNYEKAVEHYRLLDEMKEEIARFKEFFSQYGYLARDGSDLFASFKPFAIVTDEDLPLLKKSLIETADKIEKSKILNRLGNYYSMKGDYDKAYRFFDQALNNATEKLVAFILNNQAIIDVKRGDYLSAEKKMRKSYEKLKVHGMRIEVAYSLNNLAKIIELLGTVQKARKIYSQSLQILEEYNDGRGMTVILINLANQFKLIGLVNKGLEYYLRAHEIFQGDKSLLALLFQSIAELYWIAGCYDIALKRSEQACKIYEKLEIYDYYYGYNQLLQSGILADLDRIVEAKNIIDGVEKLNTRLKSKALEANILLRRGVIEQKQRNYGNAENFFQKIPVAQFLPYIESLFHSAEITSLEYLTTMDERYFGETVTRIQKVIEKAEESNFYQLLSESYLVLALLETARFNHGEALKLTEKAMRIAETYDIYEQYQKACSRLENLKEKLQQTKQLIMAQKPASNDVEEFQDYLKEALRIAKVRKLKEN